MNIVGMHEVVMLFLLCPCYSLAVPPTYFLFLSLSTPHIYSQIKPILLSLL